MKDTGTQFVLLGGPEETELAGRICLQCGSGVVSLAGKTSLMVTAAILKRCQYLITNDSGIMHLGTAVGTPVVAIFGPTRESHIGPTGRRSVVIRKGLRVEDVDVASVLVSIERLRAPQTGGR
jgi:ADP-heptose:LPS heptosyltransferase